MLCQLLLYSRVNQLYICIDSFFFGYLSHLCLHRALSRVPCAMQQVLSRLRIETEICLFVLQCSTARAEIRHSSTLYNIEQITHYLIRKSKVNLKITHPVFFFCLETSIDISKKTCKREKKYMVCFKIIKIWFEFIIRIFNRMYFSLM